MRMEELSNSKYIKGTDTVERYLLNLVQQYFKETTVAQSNSREFIIKKAVKRMKEELSFDDIGVLSITLPNGRVETGSVSLSAGDIGAEPYIPDKKSAFNVDFGDDENTACEGNDPRLSDARKPLPHQHEIDDIIGLSGILSTLSGTINRVNGYAHAHGNIDILNKIVYTGSKDVIDLGSIDDSIKQAQKLVVDIEDAIGQYQSQIPSVSQTILDSANNISNQLSSIQNSITNNNTSCLQQSNLYADTEINKVTSQFNSIANGGYVVKDKLDVVLQNALAFVGKMTIPLDSLTTSYRIVKPINSVIQNNLSSNGQTLEDCNFVFHFKDGVNNNVMYPMPHIVVLNSCMAGQINAGYYKNNSGAIQIIVSLDKFNDAQPISLTGASIILDVYARQKVTIV